MTAPLDVLIQAQQPCALVTVVGINGSAPRRLGAQMVVNAQGCVAGSLSGGCLDAAVIASAQQALAQRQNRRLRLGADSGFVDLQLPCGSGLDLQIDTQFSNDLLHTLKTARSARHPLWLSWSDATASVQASVVAATAATSVRLLPGLRIVAAGSGAALRSMVRCANAADVEIHALTPDQALFQELKAAGCTVSWMSSASGVPAFSSDPWTAVITLFHDHDWELPFLARALEGDALFVGAMGSERAHSARLDALRQRHITESTLARLRGPIGLLKRTREPAELAVSILAELFDAYRAP